MFDVETIRKDFPILDRQVHGRPLIYLDNAATTQKPHQVIDALVHYYEHYNANIHRALHTLGEEATVAYEGTRDKVAHFINSPHGPRSIVFTRNTTESLNLVAHAWGRKFLQPGDEVVVSLAEHHSNFIPWQLVVKEKGAKLRFIDIDEEGRLRQDQIESLIGPRTKIVALAHASNVLGINPVAEIAERAHRYGALMVVDGAQSVPHMPVDVEQLGCDFLAFSGHKLYAPNGIGVLYGKAALLEAMTPPFTGGGMIRTVDKDGASWGGIPGRFEAGTPPVAEAVGLGAAIDYLSGLERPALLKREAEMTALMLEGLAEREDVTVDGPGPGPARTGVVSFNLRGVHPHDVAEVLDGEGVAVRGGHHCCQVLMQRLEVPGVVRASLGLYNDAGDVERLLAGLHRVREVFGHGGV